MYFIDNWLSISII